MIIDLLYIFFSQPSHGSLLQYGQFFRYTPYKGYVGKDSFLYTISDVNGNLDTAAVNISVLSVPPQFVSFPAYLLAVEDMVSPRFGYSNTCSLCISIIFGLIPFKLLYHCVFIMQWVPWV